MWLDSQAIAWEVRQLYASRGHLQAQVTVGEPTFQDADATLPIAIDEGVLSRLVDVRIEGVDPARMTGAQDALGLSIGEPFAPSTPVDATRRLKAFYLGLGYRNAAITHEVTTGNGWIGVDCLGRQRRSALRRQGRERDGSRDHECRARAERHHAEAWRCHEPERRRHDASQSV